MSEREEVLSWLDRQGVTPLTMTEMLELAGPYRRHGWRPNGSEGLRFLATALFGPLPEPPEVKP
jgi:hypothetical protein